MHHTLGSAAAAGRGLQGAHREDAVDDALALREHGKRALEADEATSGRVKGEARAAAMRQLLHVHQLGLAGLQARDDIADARRRHLACDLFVRLLQLTALALQQDTRRRDLHLESVAPHSLNQQPQLQLAAGLNLDLVVRAPADFDPLHLQHTPSQT